LTIQLLSLNLANYSAITGAFARKADYVFALIVLDTKNTGFELTLYRAALMLKESWTKVSSGPVEEVEEEAIASWLEQLKKGELGDRSM